MDDILWEVDDIQQQVVDILLKPADIGFLHPDKDFLGKLSRLLMTGIQGA
jgi:hypothetical protein